MRWTRCARLTRACNADGEVVWFWRPDAGAKSWGMETSLRMTVARKPGHREEHEVSRKPLRRESRNASVDLWSYPRAFCCTGPTGATSTRLSLRPLFDERVKRTQTSGATRRENANAYP